MVRRTGRSLDSRAWCKSTVILMGRMLQSMQCHLEFRFSSMYFRRTVLVREATDPGGLAEDITPAGFNVRTLVHEYGGGAFTVSGDIVVFSNYKDQRLYKQAIKGVANNEREGSIRRAARAERSWRSYPGRPRITLRCERRGRRSTPNIQGRTTPRRSKKVGDMIPVMSSGLNMGGCNSHLVSPSDTNIADRSPSNSDVGALSHWSTIVQYLP
eukprot:Gb_22796 [translate_table: standard]